MIFERQPEDDKLLATWTERGEELGERRLYSTGLEDAAEARRKVMVCGENPTIILIQSEASGCDSDGGSFMFI